MFLFKTYNDIGIIKAKKATKSMIKIYSQNVQRTNTVNTIAPNTEPSVIYPENGLKGHSKLKAFIHSPTTGSLTFRGTKKKIVDLGEINSSNMPLPCIRACVIGQTYMSQRGMIF